MGGVCVIDLVEKSPMHGLLPLTIGTVTAAEVPQTPIWLVAPFMGKDSQAAKALKKMGLAWPGPGELSGDGPRAFAFSHSQIMVVGRALTKEINKTAAVTDQSDAWAVMDLSGPGVRDVLARITGLPLGAAFGPGCAARCQVAHMSGAVLCVGQDQFQVMVFRSMGPTLVHEVQTAMESVAALAGNA